MWKCSEGVFSLLSLIEARLPLELKFPYFHLSTICVHHTCLAELRVKCSTWSEPPLSTHHCELLT